MREFCPRRRLPLRRDISVHMKTLSISRFFGTLGIAALSCVAMQAASTFNFDNDAVGTNTQFADTSNGISATFLSSADPGGFSIQPSIFQALTGNVLGDPGSSGMQGLTLEIDFNTNLSALSLVFATADFGPASPFTLTAYEGIVEDGSASSTGVVPNGFTFPEGEIAFTGLFNRVILSSPAPDFAIDNIAAVAAPEPSAALLLGLGLLSLGLLPLRRLRKTYSPSAVLACGALAAFVVPAQAVTPVLPLPAGTVSTVPGNGDVNPYGVVYVPASVPTDGLLQKGDIYCSTWGTHVC